MRLLWLAIHGRAVSSQCPLQVYSLDWDTQHLVEEQALHDYPGFADSDVLMLPPRGVGEPMWPEILPPEVAATAGDARPPSAPAQAPGKPGKAPGTAEVAGAGRQPAAGDKAPATAAKDGKGSPQKPAAPTGAEPIEVCLTVKHFPSHQVQLRAHAALNTVSISDV